MLGDTDGVKSKKAAQSMVEHSSLMLAGDAGDAATHRISGRCC